MNELLYRIAFSSLKGVTMRLGRELLARCGSEESFFSAGEKQLSAINSCTNRLFSDSYRQSVLETAKKELDFITRNRVNALYFQDDKYPTRLLECDDAPLMLYGLGECDFNSPHVVGIVGTRHATPYGIEFVNNLVTELAESLDSLVVISGLAYGIDIASHRAAMAANVKTTGILAHGLNTIYPAQHRQAAAEMIKTSGGILTEYPSTSQMHKGNFLARNRIIAGMSDCIIVVESGEKGGALTTASIAQAYNRDVFALPGRISDRYSIGCNSLIRHNTAALLTSASDVTEAMGWKTRKPEGTQSLLALEFSEEEERIVSFLSENEDCDINTMCIDTGIPIGKLMTILVDMEFKGVVHPYPGGKYRLSMKL